MFIDTIHLGPIRTNCYLVTCKKTGEALLIDPGDRDPAIADTIQKRGAKVKMIAVTHAHFDHIGGNAAAVELTNAPIAIHEDALPMLQQNGLANTWSIRIEPSPSPSIFLEDQGTFTIGTARFRVLHVPGHAPGHIALYCPDLKAVFVGDVLFSGGVGRTDLPQSNGRKLIDSIMNVLFALPDDTVVYPGHGPTTTIGAERLNNPILRAI